MPFERVHLYNPRSVCRINASEFNRKLLQYRHEANAVLVDRRARRFLGMDTAATETEINGVKVKIVGGFALGPDFVSDATVIMSDRAFASLLHGAAFGVDVA